MSNLLPAARAHTQRGPLPRGFEHFSLAVFLLLLLLACVPGALAHEFKVGDLEIGHPWSRATPPGAKVAGGYFTVTNNGNAPDRLLSITSEISDKAELHEMGVKDGVMTMRPVSGGLEIPAGGKVALKPGAYHLMFVGLKRQPKQGETFPATLTFEKAGSIKVEFAVEGMGGGMDDHAE
ncbi:copper chaperone PCu(A)C [Mesorhizobium sp. M1C.F.Ca.ET.193.01.1.1]|uniref:copper chaperone PCu(A)C n=2 Tax=Mesorhizobium TaxID=68287 RepID=UPI000FD35A86|nr:MULTISPECIES: copper chaperone PCu(A)C [unclassified Mesorhizobium]TGS99172.1 copper chaperone PCu(A)C [bacterium M00.F.Ca.ET.177.01.1.1]TGQ53260.1 copper chaperone PCu(A)C [Mesorhizobium sp. M1C.F.Ca.ET.210.01.1.1]TGQ70528.1 copper chaperone PCu(A)C [Mesorhizobium sp. M1C.F.Ca.ET.212.01.1.1]TGR07080.1 copper chaperone PCu(A)C [Mesorhizobium sp. M1C.F.Ca.ET.204.01.1.1]TGR27652.1 copper chaperone PCu(A)C [Mesorhizobium sp. M1C.F.Ca.ET.196.01.1.1]